MVECFKNDLKRLSHEVLRHFVLIFFPNRTREMTAWLSCVKSTWVVKRCLLYGQKH